MTEVVLGRWTRSTAVRWTSWPSRTTPVCTIIRFRWFFSKLEMSFEELCQEAILIVVLQGKKQD